MVGEVLMNVTRKALSALMQHELPGLRCVEFSPGYTTEDFEDYDEDSVLDHPAAREEAIWTSLKADPYMNLVHYGGRDDVVVSWCFGYPRNGSILLLVSSAQSYTQCRLDREIRPPGYQSTYSWGRYEYRFHNAPRHDLLWLEDRE